MYYKYLSWWCYWIAAGVYPFIAVSLNPITFVVTAVRHLAKNPAVQHWSIEEIIRYLTVTINRKLRYGAHGNNKSSKIDNDTNLLTSYIGCRMWFRYW